MDLYGLAPDHEDGWGEYFRNTVWYWYPLWGYIKSIAPHYGLADALSRVDGATNSGSVVDATSAIKIASMLQEELDNGDAHLYQSSFEAKRDENDGHFTLENVEEFIKFARHSGGFKIC